jgi:hypothetical protein
MRWICFPRSVLGYAALLVACSLPQAELGSAERGRRLLAEIQESGAAAGAFPALAWKDVPDLLALGGSARVLTEFPRAPWASQYEESCTEGMVALWLVEGVRKGGECASLNALCFEGRVTGDDWTATSEAHHARVLEAYRAWWSRVRALPEQQAALADPLAGTGLRWH